MTVRMLKVFGNGLKPSEIKFAANAAARTFEGKRFSLPIADSVYGQGYEILLIGDNLHEVKGQCSLGELNSELEDIRSSSLL